MLRVLPEVIEPDTWILAFHRTAATWWTGLLAAGRYKHVSAFAWVSALEVWVLFEVSLAGTRLQFTHDNRRLADHTMDADLVRMPRRQAASVPVTPFSCVSSIRHLVGVPGGALRPDALFRSCLRNGGEIVGTVASPVTIDRPGDAAAAAAGRGGSPQDNPGPAVA